MQDMQQQQQQQTPSPSQQQQHHHPPGSRGYQKQPKHSPILTIKNLFDIQSESPSASASTSASASSSLHSGHSLHSTSTPFNRSNTSSISTSDNSHLSQSHHHYKGTKKLDHGLAVANDTRGDWAAMRENSHANGKVVLEVYEQKRKLYNSPRESLSPPLSMINFNFEFDNNWSLDDLPPMDDGKFGERVRLEAEASGNFKSQDLSSLPSQGDIQLSGQSTTGDDDENDIMGQSLELNSIIESMNELTLLDKFKGMFKRNSTNMLKRLNGSSFDLLLFKNGELGMMDDDELSTRIGSTSSLSNLPLPSKIKFHKQADADANETGDGHFSTIPSTLTSTPTPITPNNYHPASNSTQHYHYHHRHHHKCNRGKPTSSSSSPKRKKSFLHLRSASLPFNIFDFKSNYYTPSTTTNGKPSCCQFLDPPKSILKCKVNQNYNQESIESIKQDSVQFDEFWRKFELMEQSKNNYSNDELLNSMRLEQVRNYYYGN
ncbi:hypothetical protein CANMA_003429 [Candida margitis]|uniref:uncharacterized protein n=1 Tax=Candida margitis TaxID=1775924 RepID=UPI0022271F45|nr:uncharacterized protein CANMA_003429 [Candida margitis]KAI5964919.1 hypothetical protein CANMA_003429 [Candida margitis]